MRRWLLVVSLAMALASVVLAQATRNIAEHSTKVEDEILKLQGDWLSAEARGDPAALDRLFADDFIGTAFGGNVVNKDDVIPREGGGNRLWAKSTLKDPTVRVFGNTAVVMGRVVVEDPQQPGEFRFTMVYMKRAAGWQVVAAHLSRS